MNINLDLLEQETQTLLETAQSQILERQLEHERERQTQLILQDIESRVPPLLQQVTETISAFTGSTGDLTYKRLVDRQLELQEMLDNAPYLAAKMADAKMLDQEDAILSQRFKQELQEWRQEQKERILSLISEQTNFHDALDLAISIKGYLRDLKEVDALDEVVNALVQQINIHDRNRGKDGAIGQQRGDAEYMLNYLSQAAQKARLAGTSPKDSPVKRKSQTPCGKPKPYSNLTGKVLVFGGHERLEASIRQKLQGSGVELTWCTVDTGLRKVAQVEKQIPRAHLIIILTAYTNHTLTGHVTQAIRKHQREAVFINRGMLQFLETLEFHLKAQALSQQMGRRSA